MQRERVTDDIFVFTSDLYAQVTAGLLITDEGAVLIDTLAYPEETQQIKRFVEDYLNKSIRYVVNTHFHADHTIGTCFFPDARIIAHQKCRELLDKRGRESLSQTQLNTVALHDVQLVLPDMMFTDQFTLHIGGKTLEFWSSPGHSDDSIVCHIKEEKVLFAGDTVMSLPYFVDGNYDDLIRSLETLRGFTFETIVQGHGEVVLRGEIDDKLTSDLQYLSRLRASVEVARQSKSPIQALKAIDIESCGKSRILLNGIVEQLHRQNVNWLAEQPVT